MSVTVQIVDTTSQAVSDLSHMVANTALSASQLLELFAAVVSVAGAEMLSRKNSLTPWGWALWLIANITFSIFALMNQHWFLFAMQIWFMKTSIAGIRNHLIPTIDLSHRHAHVEHNKTPS
jgi:hypothetical protein